jgi:hypothetical protein
MPTELQAGTQTTATAKLASRYLAKYAGMSPREVDYMIQGYGGGVARYMAQGLGALAEQFGLGDKVPKRSLFFEEYPVLRGVFRNPLASSVYVERVYDEVGKLRERESLAEAGRGKKLTKAESDRLDALEDVTDALSGLRRVEREIETAMTVGELVKTLTRVQIRKHITNIHDMKRNALKELVSLEDKIATSEGEGELVTRFKHERYRRESAGTGTTVVPTRTMTIPTVPRMPSRR